jgi:uncharacterized membrane protein
VGVIWLAADRPGEWELPLFVHVLGATVLVGALLLAIVYLVPAWRGGSLEGVTAGFRVLLYAALPSFLVMRIAAEWVADKEGYSDLPDDAIPDWITIGYITGDASALFLIISLIVGGIALRRARRGDGGPGSTSTRVVTVLVSLMLVAYLVAIWAMTTKPG